MFKIRKFCAVVLLQFKFIHVLIFETKNDRTFQSNENMHSINLFEIPNASFRVKILSSHSLQKLDGRTTSIFVDVMSPSKKKYSQKKVIVQNAQRLEAIFVIFFFFFGKNEKPHAYLLFNIQGQKFKT